MQQVEFVKMGREHAGEIMAIFNHFIEHSFAAFTDQQLPVSFFDKLLELTEGYPAFVMKTEDGVAGFCMLKAYNPFPTFSSTAEISYFIGEKHTGKGIGKMALDKLTDAARVQGITTILASVSSKNPHSLHFHRKQGFTECGRLPQIGRKFGEPFDVVWFSKRI